MVLPTRIKIFFATLLYKLVKISLIFSSNKSDHRKVVRNGIHWYLDLREGIDLSIYVFGAFEKETSQALNQLIESGYYIIDIGANIGAHTTPMARAAGTNGKIIAIEPTDWAFAKLKKNVSLNPNLAERIELHQALLTHNTDEEQPAALYSSWRLESNHTQHSVHKGTLKTTDKAEIITLDHLIGKLNPSKIDLIKIDGYEYKVLSGAQSLLKKYTPQILIELSPYVHQEHGSTFEDLINLLYSYDYVLYGVKDLKPLPKSISKLRSIIPSKGGINAIAKVPAT